jgi:hypothetical protein
VIKWIEPNLYGVVRQNSAGAFGFFSGDSGYKPGLKLLGERLGPFDFGCEIVI